MNVTKTITVRELIRGAPEETLGPGQALRVKKSSGKGFLLVRESETPDLAAWHQEDEECSSIRTQASS
jgi:hypothetical protein